MLITKSLAFGMVFGTRGQHLPINGIDYDVDKLADFVAGGNNQGISLGCLIFPLYQNRYFLVVPTRMGGELSSKFLFLIPFLSLSLSGSRSPFQPIKGIHFHTHASEQLY